MLGAEWRRAELSGDRGALRNSGSNVEWMVVSPGQQGTEGRRLSEAEGVGGTLGN